MFKTQVEIYNKVLSPADKKIAEYLLTHGSSVLTTATSYELARILDIAQSTIVRFAKKLGYSGYREMLIDLSYSSEHEEHIKEIDPNDSLIETNQKINLHYKQILDVTLDEIDPSVFESVVDLLIHAKCIYFFGLGDSYLLAEHLATQFRKLGMHTICHYNALDMYMYIESGAPGDLVFLVSAKGQTNEVIKCAQIAKHLKIPVVSCTSVTKNKLYDFSDYILKTPAYDSKTALADGTRRLSQMALLDMIYLNIIRSDFKKYSARLDQSDELMIHYM